MDLKCILFINSPIHEWRKVLRHFVQANNELVVHVGFLQICYFSGSKIEKFLMLLRQEWKMTFEIICSKSACNNNQMGRNDEKLLQETEVIIIHHPFWSYSSGWGRWSQQQQSKPLYTSHRTRCWRVPGCTWGNDVMIYTTTYLLTHE